MPVILVAYPLYIIALEHKCFSQKKGIFTIGKEEVKRMQVTQSFETQQYVQLFYQILG